MTTLPERLTADLEGEAVPRITASQEIAAAVGDMALAARALSPRDAHKLHRAFILLAECQAALLSPETLPHEHGTDCTQERTTAAESNADRVAYYLQRLRHLDPGERVEVIRTRTGWSRSKIYRAIKEAKVLGIIG